MHLISCICTSLFIDQIEETNDEWTAFDLTCVHSMHTYRSFLLLRIQATLLMHSLRLVNSWESKFIKTIEKD
jgi:hypothetical protein